MQFARLCAFADISFICCDDDKSLVIVTPRSQHCVPQCDASTELRSTVHTLHLLTDCHCEAQQATRSTAPCNLVKELFVSWAATIRGPVILMVRVVRPSVCLSVRLTKRHRHMVTKKLLIGIRASRFTICRQIRDRMYGSVILGVSGSALRPL